MRSSATSRAPIIGPRNTPRIPKYKIPPKTQTRAKRGCNLAASFKTHTRIRVSTCETTKPPYRARLRAAARSPIRNSTSAVGAQTDTAPRKGILAQIKVSSARMNVQAAAPRPKTALRTRNPTPNANVCARAAATVPQTTLRKIVPNSLRIA